MNRHSRRAAAACIALLAPLALAAQADTTVGVRERNAAIRMRDGVVLRADIWRPAAEGKHPTLVYRTPYNKNGTFNGATVRKAIERGYAVVVQDVRGRYASDGVYQAYTQEGKDGYDTIEWAAAQPWSNGRIGTFGLSYPGAVQWLAAIESPPHLVAMVPAMTFATPTHFWYTGGVWDSSWLDWTWSNIAPDLRRRLNIPVAEASGGRGASGEMARMKEFFPLIEMPAFKGVAEWYYDWMRHEPYDPWWDWAELTNKYDRVKAAVLNISGWHDEMYGPAGASMNFAGLVKSRGGNARRAQTQLVIGPWTHGTGLSRTRIGTREMGPDAAVDYDSLVLGFLDKWVKEINNGVEREPAVRVYSMGAGMWRTGNAWPLPAERRSLYLGGATSGRIGSLAWTEPASGPQTTSFVSDAANPVRDPHNAAAGGRDFRALSERTDVLTFETAPLTESVEIVGPIDAEMYISVDKPDTDLWVRLLDVGPDGTAYNLMSTGLDVIRASYRNKKPTRELLEPGKVYRIDLNTLITANRFLPGHRIRVVVMASFAPNMSRNLHTGDLETVSSKTDRARITLHHGGEYKSRLVVPVRGG